MKGREIPFLWGASTSSHQIEGGNTANDWWAWEQAGRLKEPSGAACDHRRLFREDIELISRLGHKAYRFSLEWSRLEPRPDEWDEDEFDFYEEIFRELAARGIEPVVTLHHFTNPQWFADLGGWLSDDTLHYFLRYTEKVVSRFAPYVRFWCTLNEPLVYLYHGFFAGLWPPGLKSYKDSIRVYRHQVLAHVRSYRVIHDYYARLEKPVWVSLAMHLSHFTPCRPDSLKDRWAVFLRNWFANELFLDASMNGFLFFPGVFCEFLPEKGCLDFIGLNYYTRDFIRFESWLGGGFIGNACDKGHHMQEVREFNTMGWEVHPEGLYHVLKRLQRYHLPILITENGIATEDDTQRSRLIREHLNQVRRARQEGVPVAGYFYWSLLDNFEWAHGFEPRFGIVEVDYKTLERKVRGSAQVLADTCRNIDSGN